MRRLLLVIALALGAGTAHADNGMLYVGAGISRDTLSDINNNGVSFTDIENTSWKAFLGVRPISAFAVEADYLDLGSQTSNFVSVSHSDAKAFAGYAVGYLPIPIPFLDLFGKAGLARWQLSGSNGMPGPELPLFSFSQSGTGFAWGLGTQVHVGNFGGRLEYETFSIPNTSGAHLVSLSAYLNLM